MDDILARISMFAGNNNSSNSNSNSINNSNSNSNSNSTARKEPRDVSMGVLCFSKDRPYQLDQLLISIERSFDPMPKMIVVIYKHSDERWENLYSDVFKRHPKVLPVLENHFNDDLVTSLRQLHEITGTNGLICFCVDDLVFLKKVSSKQLGTALCSNDKLFSIHLKLHPGIVYSHAGSKVCNKPVLLLNDTTTTSSSSKCIEFLYSQGSADWKYPFDLCAGVYRASDVMKLIDDTIKLYDSSYLANPNIFEHTGNMIFWKTLASNYSHGACMTSPTACVVTVNCVQSVFKVPIYDTVGGDLESLNNLLTSSEVNQYDISKYELEASLHVHVGTLLFEGEKIPRAVSNTPMVSVLLPVYNGEKFILSCIKTLLESKQQCIYEVIIVDDGSVDKTLEIIDHFLDSYSGPVKVHLIKSTHVGLIGALETGLNHVSDAIEFIARIDCDDLCWDGRLDKQLRYLLANSDIHVLGSQAVLFSEDADNVVASGIPSNKYLVAWNMMFRCCILHPTVMFRKSVIKECLSYSGFRDSKTECVEDYDLWMRVLEKYPFSATNVPDVFVSIRRHASSKSRLESDQLREGSLLLQVNAINSLLNCDDEIVKVVAHPQINLNSVDVAMKAMSTISSIYEAFIERLPIDVRDDSEVIALLVDSKTKMERRLFRCAVAKFGSNACVGLNTSEDQANVLKDLLLGQFEEEGNSF